MNRSRKSSPLAAALALLAGGALTGGCMENKSSVYIHQIMAPCGDVTFSPDEPFISEGAYDPAGGGYNVPILIGNQLTPLGDPDTLKPETSRFIIKGIEVTVLSGNLSNELTAFTSVAAGTVSPSDSLDPGFGGIRATIVPANLAVQAGQRIVSRIRVFGETLAGTSLETGEYDFPIRVLPRGSLAVGVDPATGECTDPTADSGDVCGTYSCALCPRVGGTINCFAEP